MNKRFHFTLICLFILGISLIIWINQDIKTEVEVVEKIVDFGEVKSGQKLVATFRIKNIGESDLKILKVSADCNCTVPEWNNDLVMPKKETSIVVFYNNLSAGYFQQKVTVETNAVNSPLLLLIRGRAL